MVVVEKFILSQAPVAHAVTNLGRNARVIRQKVHEPLLIRLMLPDDLSAALVRGIGIIVVVTDIICAERAVIIHVGLMVRERVEFLKRLTPARVEHS